MKRRGHKTQRGVALLLVLVGLAVLALLAQESRYNSIVEQRMATNARDEMRAHYLAKSGIGLARLMLRFQKQVDSIQLPPGLTQMLGPLLGMPPGAPGAPAGMPGMPGGGG